MLGGSKEQKKKTMMNMFRTILKSRNIFQSFRKFFKSFHAEDLGKGAINFISHNKKVWKNFSSREGPSEILLEINQLSTSLIAFSYLGNVLAKRHKSLIKGYYIKKKSLKERILQRHVKKLFNSFNAELMNFSLTPTQMAECEKLFFKIRPELKTKRDVEKLKVGGIWIGDLLYDSHLLKKKEPTVNLGSQSFDDSLRGALSYLIFWNNYFDTHNVKSLVVTHCWYYQNAVVLRIAIERDIPCYLINVVNFCYLSKSTHWSDHYFFEFPEIFSKLEKDAQQAGLQLAKERIDLRLSGQVGVDMAYSSKSAYTRKSDIKVLRESPKTKVLIATHCFFDSAHPYGLSLYPDFYEWLTALGEISNITDYDWYIKTHPDFRPGNVAIIEGFITKYQKFTLIPPETSHHQIIEEGIDFVLTVHGTIGFEYAALGVPVINASTVNPHIAYNSIYTPKM